MAPRLSPDGSLPRPRKRARALLLVVAALAPLGCTHQHRVAAGPAVAYPDGSPSWGLAAVLARGTGSSDAKAKTYGTLDENLRVLVTERTQHVRAGLGPQRGMWLGSVLVDAAVALGPGLERFDGRGYFTLGGGASLSVGMVLAETKKSGEDSFFPWGLPRRIKSQSSHTVLTLGLLGDTDFRLTRAPLGAVSLLVGLSWVDEVTFTPVPLLPPAAAPRDPLPLPER